MKNPETLFMGQHIIHLSDIDSTNNFAANLIKQTKVVSGTVILADNQTAGRGQSGNQWHANPGENLTFSLILHPRILAKNQFIISKITCLALLDLLEENKLETKIKWPNDLLINQHKIAGILIENTLRGQNIESSIIGIGLNVNQNYFHENRATSLNLETGVIFDRVTLLHQFLKFMERWYLALERGDEIQIDQIYTQNLFGRNELRNYIRDGSEFEGKIKGVNRIGQLEMELVHGKTQYFDNQEIKFCFD
ncbi:MAG: biotin--[acetyl-CoA-carboxylase] ligase [Crocinitomicaceae bacterium]